VPADIILYALIAGGLVFWLKNLLGERHGEESERSNPFTSKPDAGTNAAKEGSGKTADNVIGLTANQSPPIIRLDRHMSVTDGAQAGLESIKSMDRNFSVSKFMGAAENAFTIIIEAFAEGDRDTLKNLLSGSVYDAFSGVLDQREKDGETADVEIHSIRKMELLRAHTAAGTGYITVRFVADETNLLRDEKDNLIYGDPERITETVDIWTFSRNLKSGGPAWLISETRDEDAADEDHKTVPDADQETIN